MKTTTSTVINQQPKEVQALCDQFTNSYNKHRKTVAEWGKYLLAIRDGNLNPVNAEGEALKGEDVMGATFSSICKELGVPRSTAYHYINIHLVTSTYPEWLQEAATANSLNLAAEHVQAVFEDIRESLPAKPDSLQAAGIIATLKKAKPVTTPTPKGNPRDRLRTMLNEAVQFARKNDLLEKAIMEHYDKQVAANPSAELSIEEAIQMLKLDWEKAQAAI